MEMFSIVRLLLSSFVFCSINAAPEIGSRFTNNGFHSRFEITIDPDPSKPSRCLFVWHRLPPYLYVEPDELYQLNATILGSIDIEAPASKAHPFAYCFILYNSTRLPFRNTLSFSLNVHSRYLDAKSDSNEPFETHYLPEPVIHYTEKPCPKLGAGCPAPLAETAIESPRELTVNIPIGHQEHLQFVFPVTVLFATIGCSMIFVYSQRSV